MTASPTPRRAGLPARRAPAALAALPALALLAGCRAQRHLVIETDPPGATVRLDDELVGQTPLDLRFEHYGKRQLTLYRSGFRTYSEVLDVDTPWWSEFPLDLVTEVLLPFGWEDVHRYQVDLEPESGRVTAADLAEVLERAETLRRAGPAGPAAPAPDAPPPAKATDTVPAEEPRED